jgi:hypothetical protein
MVILGVEFLRESNDFGLGYSAARSLEPLAHFQVIQIKAHAHAPRRPFLGRAGFEVLHLFFEFRFDFFEPFASLDQNGRTT